MKTATTPLAGQIWRNRHWRRLLVMVDSVSPEGVIRFHDVTTSSGGLQARQYATDMTSTVDSFPTKYEPAS